MATVIVRSDSDNSILMSEHVGARVMDDQRSSVGFLERLATAIDGGDKLRGKAVQARRARRRLAR